MTTYNPIIPQPTDLLSNSQPSILGNFTQLNTQYGADHDGFNTGSGNGSGMHDQVTFLANQSAPSLTRNSVAGTSGLYVNTVSGSSCLFFQNSTQNLQLTGATTIATSGSVVLVGGIVLKWGVSSFSGTGTSVNVNYSGSFPSNVFGVQGTAIGGSGAVLNVINTASLSSFTMRRNGDPTSDLQFYWMAIGN